MSAHDDLRLTVTSGRSHHNTNGGITSVANSQMTIGGIEVDHNFWRFATAARADEGGVSFYDSTMAGSITGVNSHDNIGPGFYVRPGASVTWSGLTSTANSMPDVLP
jgi:hypothetical protein